MLLSVFLRGGADTLNLLVPKGDDAYFRARKTLAIKNSIDLDGFYGLHPRATPLLPLFREGKLAFVQAVGCDDSSGSHFEVQDRVERGDGAGGWIARTLRSKKIGGSLSAVAIGDRIPETLRGAPQAVAMRTVSELSLRIPGGSSPARRALSLLYEDDVLLGDPGKATLEVLSRVENLGSREDNAELEFAIGLKEIARLARADVGLEAACVDLANWDTHFVQSSIHSDLVSRLATGLAAFHGALEDVTTVVLTEFGRRNEENGSAGTDHGRGYAMMVIGAGVRGGKVYGAWPGLDADPGPGPGGLPVRIDHRAVLAEIVEKMGARAEDVFPSLARTKIGVV